MTSSRRYIARLAGPDLYRILFSRSPSLRFIMADTRTSRNVGNKDFTRSTVVIIGAGISGTSLCSGRKL